MLQRLDPEQPYLDILSRFLIAVSVGEKVSIDVIGHLDSAVPQSTGKRRHAVARAGRTSRQ
jgi:hypothetical protein